MWQILHAFFWEFTKLSNSGISLNWSITDEVATCNTTACFFGPLCMCVVCLCWWVVRWRRRWSCCRPCSPVLSRRSPIYSAAAVNMAVRSKRKAERGNGACAPDAPCSFVVRSIEPAHRAPRSASTHFIIPRSFSSCRVTCRCSARSCCAHRSHV